VIYRPLLLRAAPPANAPDYFPRTGRKPGYGRLEIVPPPGAPKPPPAPTYYRSWSSQSAPLPPTEYQQYQGPPAVVEPRYRRDRHGNGVPKGTGPGRH
jgi:hypothetical protein